MEKVFFGISQANNIKKTDLDIIQDISTNLDQLMTLEPFATTNIGSRLRTERKRLKMTQAEFAEKLSVGRLSVFRHEAGQRYPNAEYLQRCEKIGVDIYYVLTGRALSENIDLPAMEKAVELVLELTRNIDSDLDVKIITSTLIQFYRRNLASTTNLQ